MTPLTTATPVLLRALDEIRPLDRDAAAAARLHIGSLTKPPGSLGRLEELAERLAAIQGHAPSVDRKALLIFAGDHGVTRRGVSAYRADVTPQMVLNFLRGGAAANVLARQAGATVTVVDVGVDCDFGELPGLVSRKVRRGTRDLCAEDAMTGQECLRAIDVGVELAREHAGRGAGCLIAGEMGIGNTTAATAIFCAMYDLLPSDVVGRGTGVDDAGLLRKCEAIELALARHAARANRESLDILASLGGYEIAAIAGLAIGAAATRTPLIVDGFIATAGAAVAFALDARVHDFLFFGHRSNERAHHIVLQRLGARPLLDLDMRLGEGTGALLASHLLEAACRMYAEMATFATAGVSERS
ncbi:MAG TPA: nicotinate-nucleotide--dimethylbenzimidazole phosphoribosyltransferase [Thermoanaerobaculia bacterium]|nr:nicotinate-nucleotide--dimethylbenzimidazole phosphoribosyltransferase [Thermoanaerobaculia bacterium]